MCHIVALHLKKKESHAGGMHHTSRSFVPVVLVVRSGILLIESFPFLKEIIPGSLGVLSVETGAA